MHVRRVLRCVILTTLAATATGVAEPYVVAAGRSPLAQAGESFDRPIAPAILVELSPLAAPRPALATPDDARPIPVVPWDEAGEAVGQVVAAEGTIVDANDIGRLTFLNFTEDWRGKFYVVVFREAYPDLPGPPEEAYLGRTIRVTGRVEMHRGAPQIRVYDASQIAIVE